MEKKQEVTHREGLRWALALLTGHLILVGREREGEGRERGREGRERGEREREGKERKRRGGEREGGEREGEREASFLFSFQMHVFLSFSIILCHLEDSR